MAAEEEKEFELPFKILGHPVKIPKLTRLPRLPDWLRVILKYRFPSSIDPYTGEPSPDRYSPTISTH